MFQDMFVGMEDPAHLGRVTVRLVVACLAGGLIGFERQVEHKTVRRRPRGSPPG